MIFPRDFIILKYCIIAFWREIPFLVFVSFLPLTHALYCSLLSQLTLATIINREITPTCVMLARVPQRPLHAARQLEYKSTSRDRDIHF